MMDLSPFVKLRISGPRRAGLRAAAGDGRPGPAGRQVTYTVLLNERGGIVADLTITRLADDEFLLIDGAGTGLRTITRVRDLAPDGRLGARRGRSAPRCAASGCGARTPRRSSIRSPRSR